MMMITLGGDGIFGAVHASDDCHADGYLGLLGSIH
jgi:hypothetical protein